MERAENKTSIHSSRNLDAALICSFAGWRGEGGGALDLSRLTALACIIYLFYLHVFI